MYTRGYAMGNKKRGTTLWPFPCDSGGIQTCNLLIRSQVLYSVKLRSPMFPYRKGNTFFWYGQYPARFFLLGLGLGAHYPFLDIGPLACEAAEVVDSIPPNLPELVHLDFLDEG